MDHVENLSDEQLVGLIKPILAQENWEYLAEYFRREQSKHLTTGMTSPDTVVIYRAQGATKVFSDLLRLKQTVLEASK